MTTWSSTKQPALKDTVSAYKSTGYHRMDRSADQLPGSGDQMSTFHPKLFDTNKQTTIDESQADQINRALVSQLGLLQDLQKQLTRLEQAFFSDRQRGYSIEVTQPASGVAKDSSLKNHINTPEPSARTDGMGHDFSNKHWTGNIDDRAPPHVSQLPTARLETNIPPVSPGNMHTEKQKVHRNNEKEHESSPKPSTRNLVEKFSRLASQDVPCISMRSSTAVRPVYYEMMHSESEKFQGDDEDDDFAGKPSTRSLVDKFSRIFTPEHPTSIIRPSTPVRPVSCEPVHSEPDVGDQDDYSVRKPSTRSLVERFSRFSSPEPPHSVHTTVIIPSSTSTVQASDEPMYSKPEKVRENGAQEYGSASRPSISNLVDKFSRISSPEPPISIIQSSTPVEPLSREPTHSEPVSSSDTQNSLDGSAEPHQSLSIQELIKKFHHISGNENSASSNSSDGKRNARFSPVSERNGINHCPNSSSGKLVTKSQTTTESGNRLNTRSRSTTPTRRRSSVRFSGIETVIPLRTYNDNAPSSTSPSDSLENIRRSASHSVEETYKKKSYNPSDSDEEVVPACGSTKHLVDKFSCVSAR